MPSVSKKQHNLMALVANNPKASKRLGIPQSVGKEFMKADKGKTFSKGGEMKESKKMVKKEVEFMKKKGAPKSMIKHEMSEMEEYRHGGKVKKMAAGGMPVNPRAAAMMRKRAAMGARPDQMQNRPTMGRPIGAAPAPAPTMPMKKGGKTMSRMTSKGEHSVQKKSKRGAEMVKMAGGGYVKSADGVATKGKTKGTMISMSAGGKTKKYC
jgi:hypothetical protein